MGNDKPIHLAEYDCSIKEEHSERCVNMNVCIRQSDLDGLFTLMSFCDGFSKSGNGTVPGSFELRMFYRNIGATLYAEKDRS